MDSSYSFKLWLTQPTPLCFQPCSPYSRILTQSHPFCFHSRSYFYHYSQCPSVSSLLSILQRIFTTIANFPLFQLASCFPYCIILPLLLPTRCVSSLFFKLKHFETTTADSPRYCCRILQMIQPIPVCSISARALHTAVCCSHHSQPFALGAIHK